MPPRRVITPKSLEDLCLSEIVSYLSKECLFCAQVRQYQDGSLLLQRRGIDAGILEKELEDYLNILPPLLNEIVRQHVTNAVLGANGKSALSLPEIYVGLLKIVLNKEIKSLELSDENHINCESPLWPIFIKKCQGLKRFVFTHKMNVIQGASHIQPCLRKIIINCPTLTELILKNMVQGYETLTVIGKFCHVLKVLDIGGSSINCIELAHLLINSHTRNINIDRLIDGSVRLPKHQLCYTLEVLILAETNVKIRGAALAIQVLPCLVSLGNFIHLPSAIKLVFEMRGKLPTLNVSRVFYDGSSSSKLKMLASCCPNLESLRIGCERIRRIHPSYFNYKYLRSLTLENVEFAALLSCSSILPQLIELELTSTDIDVGLLGLYCQNLEKLTLCGELSRVPTTHLPNCIPFNKLKELKIQCIVFKECVGLIIRHALDLKVMDIIRVKEFNDDVLAEWFQWNPFQKLETLIIRYAELTRVSVDFLVENCPQLTRLGQLCGWDVRSWECRRLKELVLRENYKLHLILFSRKAGSVIIDMLAENISSEDELV